MKSRFLALVATLVVLSNFVTFYPQPANASAQVGRAQVRHHHPKLKKWLMIAGIGALTGGVGGAVLGTGLAHGAALGAGSHVAFHSLRDKWKRHKTRLAALPTKSAPKRQHKYM